jgi:class 3 adenylate cyclase
MTEAAASEAYGDRIVGFVDILGFADLVGRAHNDPDLRARIVDALDKVRTTAAPGDGATGLRTQNFSDSLILSADHSPDGLWHLLLSLDALAIGLLEIGVLIRGGVTIGGMHQGERVVFGVAVNEAYRLESVVAKVPRVVLSARAIDAANRYAQEHEIWETYRNSRLLRDADGVWHLNYLTELGIFNRQDPSNFSMTVHPIAVVGRSLQDIIQAKIDGTLDQPDVYAKIEWLARYWNAEVAFPRVDGKSPVLGSIRLAGQEPRTTPLPFRTF